MIRTSERIALTAGMLRAPAMVIALALALGSPVFAGTGHQAVRIDGPIALDGHVFPAGLLELAPCSRSGHLWAIALEGQRVALAFLDGSTPASGLALYRDEAGLFHLRGLQIARIAGGASEYVYRRAGRVELHASVARRTWPIE